RPSGGVTIPSDNETIMTTPKCTGSTPISDAIGTSIGASMMIDALVSINIPMNSNNRTTSNRNIIVLSVTDVIVCATCCGTFSIVRIQLNSPAVARMNMMEAVVSVAVVSTVLIFLMPIPL